MVNYLCQIVSILLYSKNLGHDKRNNYEGRNETTITTQYDLEKSFEVYMKGDAKKCFLLQLWATFILFLTCDGKQSEELNEVKFVRSHSKIFFRILV